MSNVFEDPQPAPDSPGIDRRELDQLLDRVVGDLQAAGRPVGKIAAIKGLRDRRPMGLSQAKEAVEDYGRRRGIESLVNPDVHGGGCLFAIAALAILALGVAFLWRSIQP